MMEPDPMLIQIARTVAEQRAGSPHAWPDYVDEVERAVLTAEAECTNGRFTTARDLLDSPEV